MMLELPEIATTLSVWTSFFASAVTLAGVICSVSANNLIGWPLTPPFALTHAKYAPSMFSMSLKSVPGTLVLIAPTGIGLPVAFLPGLDPHDDVELAAWATTL